MLGRGIFVALGLGLSLLSGVLTWTAAQPVEGLKPFVLASTIGGSLQQALQAVRQNLRDQGFELAGESSPYDGAVVLVVTNDFLRELAAQEAAGAYLLGQRIALVRVGSEVQVSYANPEYLRYAYRVEQDVSPVVAGLRTALGYQEQFGAEGLSARELQRYHYTFGMEYFDEPMDLAQFDSHEGAVRTVAENLKQRVAGTAPVYRIDAARGKTTVFGVAMSEGLSSDAHILGEIDVGPLKHVAHLPYEIAVFDGAVQALHPRFRIAIGWPDLKMVGDNSFFSITRSPEAIKNVLTKVAGGNRH
jgi:hypothetical protein